MRYLAVITLLFFPTLLLASCNQDGATVVYVNGIFSNVQKAQDDLENLHDIFVQKTGDRNLKFLNGFNPSHLAGGGDLLKSWVQDRVAAGTYVEDYDLKTILLNLHSDLTTRKVLLVGHSQGTYYTNEMYEYLVAHGLPKESLQVYNIATPASYVAGKGTYLNSSGDTMLRYLADALGFKPLAYNINLVSSIDDALRAWPGHSLAGAYLADAGDRVVADMSSEISGLTATASEGADGCFTPPARNTIYTLQQIGFAIGDPAAIALRDGAVAGYKGTVAAAKAVGAATKKAYAVLDAGVRSVVGLVIPAPRTENLPGSFTVVKALYGSSLTEKEVQELLKDQGGAAALATPTTQKKDTKQSGLVLGVQTDTPAAALPAPKVIKQRSKHKSSVQETTPVSVPSETEAGTESTEEVATTTPEIIVEEAPPPADTATTTASTTPSGFYTMASQPDESFLCAFVLEDGYGWRTCFTVDPGRTPQVEIALGKGSELGSGSIHSVTIALDISAFSLLKEDLYPIFEANPWVIQLLCYTDATYSQTCQDWIGPNSWNSSQTFVLSERAAHHSEDKKYWTAYFDETPTHGSNADGSFPVRFNPDYYYRLIINDNGWVIGAYGSATQPYWVLTGKND